MAADSFVIVSGVRVRDGKAGDFVAWVRDEGSGVELETSSGD